MGKFTSKRRFCQGDPIGTGQWLKFIGFRGDRAAFSLERHTDMLFSVEILHVPIGTPRNRRDIGRVIGKARRRAIRALEVA